MSDPALLTLAEASQAIGAGRLSPVDLVEACLARIARIDPQIHAFVTLCREGALKEAQASRCRAAEGRRLGPLDGIPLAMKDIVETAGVLTTGNSALFADRVPERSATLWARLEAAGAILIGKTTTWEFALGGTAFDLPWPPARNPWDLSRDTGGSSSGSAAAVAAGLCAGAIGTDTGGSIRVPAGWCGCAGLKPTYGLVSRAGIYPLSHTLDHAGPICWTAEDCALVMQAIAGPDPRDRTSRGAPALDFGTVRDGVRGLRLGRWRGLSDTLKTDPAVAANMERAVAGLVAAGATVTEVDLPPLAEFDGTCQLISRVEAFVYHRANLLDHPDLFGAESRARMLAGGVVGAAEYIEAQRNRTWLIAEVERVMQGVDLLVCELSGSTAPEMGGATTYGRLASRPFNVTGAPALSVCTGFDAAGLPTAMQIVGRAFEDDLVLRAGHVVEAATGSRARRAMAADPITA